MTTYKQNTITINADTCAVSTEARVIGLGCLRMSSEKSMRSNVACGILQGILKTVQVEFFNSTKPLALLAIKMETKVPLFPRFEATFNTYLRMVRNFLENLTATMAKSQATFAKRILSPHFGPLNHALAVSM